MRLRVLHRHQEHHKVRYHRHLTVRIYSSKMHRSVSHHPRGRVQASTDNQRLHRTLCYRPEWAPNSHLPNSRPLWNHTSCNNKVKFSSSPLTLLTKLPNVYSGGQVKSVIEYHIDQPSTKKFLQVISYFFFSLPTPIYIG